MEKYYGKYAGIVFNNLDPKKRGRIKAYVPKIGLTADGAGTTEWALPVLDHPGKWYGPPINTKVWVEFEGGDINIPIWTGCFVGASGAISDLPLRAQGTDDGTEVLKGSDTFLDTAGGVKTQPVSGFAAIYPSNNIIKLSNGITIEYDDTKGAERVMIFHPTGTYIEMLANGKCVMKTNSDFWKTIGTDLFEHVVANLFQNVGANFDQVIGADLRQKVGGNISKNVAGNYSKTVVGNSTETATGNKEINASSIRLGLTASLGVMLESIIAKFNLHTHNVTAVGAPSGPPIAPNQYILGTDSTNIVKAE